MDLQQYDENGSFAAGFICGATEALNEAKKEAPAIDCDKIVTQIITRDVDTLEDFAYWVDSNYLPEIFEFDETNVLKHVSNTIMDMVKIYKERGKYQCVK